MKNLALSSSSLNFVKASGKILNERCEPFYEWQQLRIKMGVFPYSRVLFSPALHNTVIADEFGCNPTQGINFSSQDYLGLTFRQELKDAAHEIINEYGVHSAGSPAFCGRTNHLLELENKLTNLVGHEECIIYSTGWMAGFGVITGLVREYDTIMIDALSHNCLHEGAKHATSNIQKFAHNDIEKLADKLRNEREQDSEKAIFIVVESLYSMDSDNPNLKTIVELAYQYEAIVILDVAHDFGAMGEQGLGLLEQLTPEERRNLIVMGSFSKTFAANGGFVLCSKEVRQYLRYYSSSNTFSNAISPMQTAVVNKAFDIVFSNEGQLLRNQLLSNVNQLRNAMTENGLLVSGEPSPIVPVFLQGKTDDEALARLTSKHLLSNGVHANLVEFPAVPRGKARFRFQVMATHESDEIKRAAEMMAVSREAAIGELQTLSN
jgi:7-keto-8-aminopelargonate synthetase-like enzyme